MVDGNVTDALPVRDVTPRKDVTESTRDFWDRFPIIGNAAAAHQKTAVERAYEKPLPETDSESALEAERALNERIHTMLSTQVRCESGYLFIGDPCYVLTPDSSETDEVRRLTDPGLPLDMLGVDAAAVGRGTGFIIRATTGEITVYTIADIHDVAGLVIRLDGKAEALNLDNSSKRLLGTVFVDAGLMGVHDPSITINGPGGYLYTDWMDFCDALPTDRDVLPYNPDGEKAVVVSSTGYGDGEYNVLSIYDRDQQAYGILVEFINLDRNDTCYC